MERDLSRAATLTTGASMVTTASIVQRIHLKALSAPFLRTNLTPGGNYCSHYPDVTKKEENELVPGYHRVCETTFRRKSAATASSHHSQPPVQKNGHFHEEVQRQDSRPLQHQLQSPNYQGHNLLQNQFGIHYFHHEKRNVKTTLLGANRYDITSYQEHGCLFLLRDLAIHYYTAWSHTALPSLQIPPLTRYNRSRMIGIPMLSNQTCPTPGQGLPFLTPRRTTLEMRSQD